MTKIIRTDSHEITEVLYAHGHENVQSTHKTTFEVTREPVLTKRGDCIIAVGATKGAADLSPRFKEAAKREGAKMTITIKSDEVMEVVRAEGSPRLLFTHPMDLVVRKSDYVCGRTIAIRTDKAAADLSREFVKKLTNPCQRVEITLTVKGR